MGRAHTALLCIIGFVLLLRQPYGCREPGKLAGDALRVVLTLAQLKQYFGINSNSTSAEASTFNVNYNLLYSVYSFPNTVRMPLKSRRALIAHRFCRFSEAT